MNKRFVTVVFLSCTTVLAGCAKKAPEDLPPPPPPVSPVNEPVPPAPAPSQPPLVPSGPAIGTQAHFEQATNGQSVIYFDTDRFNIDSTDSVALQVQAQYLAQYSEINVTIEGHADERGTREYNLALGERRANATKNYLVSLGISSDRIATVSYGKERPEAVASNEEAWAQNRRAASVVVD